MTFLSLFDMNMIPSVLFDHLIQDMCSDLGFEARLTRLLSHLRQYLSAGAIACLQKQDHVLKPLVQFGLSADVMGRRFTISENPRFEHIFNKNEVVRFSDDCDWPDPYDGMLLSHPGDLPVHSCMGFPIQFENHVHAVITLDSLQPGQFDHYSHADLSRLNSLVAATYKVAMLQQQVKHQQHHTRAIINVMNNDAWLREGTELIGESTAIRAMRTDIGLVARSDFTVLIAGETGVGKELVARMLHQQSSRATAPLVYVNCAAIPQNLVESELFGHIKGAFTGADKDRVGKFSLAHQGTLFLDEIGELPLATQSKLLRALQNQEIQRVGKDQIEKIDVRIIAATNRELEVEVAEGRFRADLYHRLSVYPINVPPLRRRDGDITLLAGYFTEQLKRKLGIQQLLIAPAALSKLEAYQWPGNVRELEHVISRAALRTQTGKPDAIVKILPQHIETLVTDGITDIPVESRQNELTTVPEDFRQATAQFQKQLISQTLTKTAFNWSATARDLNLDRSNLVRLAKRLGLSVEKKLGD